MLSKLLPARRVLRHVAPEVSPAIAASHVSFNFKARSFSTHSHTHTALKDKCDAAIADMKASGTYKAERVI